MRPMTEQEEQDQLALHWLFEWIPRAYRFSKIELLPDPEATKQVLEFEPGDPYHGFYLYGATGSGKTRSLVLRLKRFVAEFEDVIYLRGKQFSDEVVERTRPGGKGNFHRWFETLTEAGILAIDEVDKMSFSNRVRAEFFELVEVRTSSDSPLLFIAQCSVDRLAQKLGPKAKEEAAGIVRRIKENCLPIYSERKENSAR